MDQFWVSLITSIFIGGAAGYLGSLMVSKRMALVGDALGHVALPGIALALLLGFDVSLGALPFLFLGILLIWLFEIRTHLPMEVLTGVVFTASVAIAFLFLPQSEISHALIGDISKITPFSAAISIISALIIFFVVKKILPGMSLAILSEDLARVTGIKVKKYNFIYLVSIAIIVALGVKVVGSLLMGALVIIPAAIARNLSRSLNQYSFAAMGFGVLVCILGLLFFRIFGFPAGPIIILTAALLFLISLIFKRGLD